ncbi:hypothetical protein BV133_1513 [Blastochloris viridis]|uniref:Uncharacterized protein n=1 Tax=Blastochloris viridis TaxID=1079 RepID=A0A182D0S6_BLAVI|nr:hypothetical protein BV133_1513 [Blastochloris viridis]
MRRRRAASVGCSSPSTFAERLQGERSRYANGRDEPGQTRRTPKLRTATAKTSARTSGVTRL